MVDVICKCGKKFKARQSDINRGWGKFCSKSCKALFNNPNKSSSRSNIQIKSIRDCNSFNDYLYEDIDYDCDGWDAHKDSF